MYSPVLIWYWGRRGGGANFTVRLAKLLACGIGPESVFVAIVEENEYRSTLEELGVNLIVAPAAWAKGLSLRQRLRFALRNLAFARKLRHGSFGTVIVAMNFPLAWPLVCAIRRSSTRLVYVAHDAEPHPGDYLRKWQRWSQSQLIRRANAVVALSTAVAARLVEIFSDVSPDLCARLHTIPIETLFSARRVRHKQFSSDKVIRFLFLGRLLDYKGLDLLYEALIHLDCRRDWTLTIAGSGTLESFCAETFGRHPRCQAILGWIDNERFVELLDEHDVLLCPYTEASQSGVIPEALERGLAVIVTPIKGLAEQTGFGRSGFVATDVSAAAFAAAMIRILDEPILLQTPLPLPHDLGAKQSNWLSLLVRSDDMAREPGERQ